MPLSDKTKAAVSKTQGLPQGMRLRPVLLMTGTIPMPMYGLAPRVVLGGAWWDKVRQEAYESTNYHCLACGVHKRDAQFHQWLEAHETYKINWARGTMTYKETVPLCHACHNFTHRGRLEYLLQKGKITYAKYAAIIQHGERVLRKSKSKLAENVGSAELRRSRGNVPQDLQDKIAAWDDWRLVVNGKKYKPLKTEAEAMEDALEGSD